VKLATLVELGEARAAKRAVALATWLDGSDQQLLTPETAPPPLAQAVRDALRSDEAVTVDGVFVEPHNPPARLIVVGAVHVAEPLAKMAPLAGFAVTIVDPRRAWATPARFPDQTLVLDWPDAAVAALAPDARTAVVTLTHDPKLDDPALVAALRTPAFYIGCLGSKKTHAARLDRLASAGCTGLDRLHGPVGLPIGARSPSEIALAILAEVVATLRGAA
jgi:xanthine dehydrogenase accessory factor